MSELWHPSATLENLQQLAHVRQQIREYMQHQGVMEVVTPALSTAATTDPHINSVLAGERWLHTSPEFPMKRLLAAYTCDIYQLATVFRDGEQGRFHNPEFTLLEWYRIGFDHHRLMKDVEGLLRHLYAERSPGDIGFDNVSYADAIFEVTGKRLSALETSHIRELFIRHERSWPASLDDDLDAALDLLVDEFVLPGFAADRFTFLSDYPASQASLARCSINENGDAIAERFELYRGTLELANGFHELTDAQEQRSRFEQDLQRRAALELPEVKMDTHLVAALGNGLPQCAGVALGVDRLMMLLTNSTHMQDVQAFSWDRA